jgi:alpha-tubulin suppressor-like RCC1 family protein
MRENIVDFDFGYHHVLACNSAGELFCWGRNSYGQLGDEELVDFTATPTRVAVKKQVAQKRQQGGNRDRDRDRQGKKAEGGEGAAAGGGKLPVEFNHRVVKVSTGFAHSFVLTDTGEVFAFGRNMARDMRPNKVILCTDFSSLFLHYDVCFIVIILLMLL